MARWKLIRQKFGSEEYTFFEGNKVTIGRDLNNTVALKSLVISRNHCVISFKKDEVTITDLKSANGVYVGLKKLPPNTPFSVSDEDIIGIGWTYGVQGNVQDNQKYIFKLHKEKSLSERIKFQNENELHLIEAEIISINRNKETTLSHPNVRKQSSPILNTNSQLKRKLSLKSKDNKENVLQCEINTRNDDIIVLSDSDHEANRKIDIDTGLSLKKTKMDPDVESVCDKDIKFESDHFKYEAFDIKQEYLGYDEEAIQVDSDTDSESEQWLMRLSQSSPGKAFINVKENLQTPNRDSSYSQLDEDVFVKCGENLQAINNGQLDKDEFIDLIKIPPHPILNDTDVNRHINKDVVCSDVATEISDQLSTTKPEKDMNVISKKLEPSSNSIKTPLHGEVLKRIQLIDPLNQPSIKKPETTKKAKEKQSKPKSSSKIKKSNKDTTPRKSITSSQKEERKKKLKEIASKDKDETISPTKDSTITNNNNANKSIVNVKVTASNRGAFLTNLTEPNIKSTRKENNFETNDLQTTNLQKEALSSNENKNHNKTKKNNKETHSKYKSKTKNRASISPLNVSNKKEIEDTQSNNIMFMNGSTFEKPVSVVGPFPQKKTKKRVTFADNMHEIHVFQIETGNKMKKTSTARTALIEKLNKGPIFSLEKITLMKILRWNPHWLNEQLTNVDPPPILGHDNLPRTIFHSFDNHNQYIEMVGDLLLMEIWECLTQAFEKNRSNTNESLPLRIESLPPVPPQERYFELTNISVNISVPCSDVKKLPRVGEIMIIEMGPDNSKVSRFFYVHNVRNLPSPPSNKFSFFSISLYTTFTDRMKFLKPGELIKGKTLAYIHKELALFDAMEHLADSPLNEAILRPKPHHFTKIGATSATSINCQWTVNLNSSQKMAVNSSIGAALSGAPSVQLVQGPPGTGKSSVICAMVMSHFYDPTSKKQSRSKVLICATSNAAVDGLVIKLLNIRQELPKSERFRMVRVGRLESMHPRARDVSSQQLALRDVRSQADVQLHSAALAEEISHLQAKLNMWQTQAREAKDPVRVAYCQGRVSSVSARLTMLQAGGGGGGGEPRPEQLLQSERRIIECADIIVTTLGSAHSHKMRGIKGRIALCIVDEAGQAIEPEALIPLTLGVQCLTLIGDPQQLPGFICSQRARKHGLGESVFSRLTSFCEQWSEGNPVVLLDKQYRMHPAIADYPNRAFYGGRVHNMTSTVSDLSVPPYCIVNISSGDRGQVSSGANETEAWGVARMAGALAGELRDRRLSVALITPYAAHRDLLRRCLHELHDASVAEAVEVNTVDSFQGQERDVVLVSLARSSGVGFLTDTGRMNVMLTRARLALIVCLNSHALMRNHQWMTLVEDAQHRQLYTNLPAAVCQRGGGGLRPSDVLSCITNLKTRHKK